MSFKIFQFFCIRGDPPRYIPSSREGLRLPHPHRGLRPRPLMHWDWNLSQLVFSYYWLSFLSQVNASEWLERHNSKLLVFEKKNYVFFFSKFQSKKKCPKIFWTIPKKKIIKIEAKKLFPSKLFVRKKDLDAENQYFQFWNF